jgi:hypothetical protein
LFSYYRVGLRWDVFPKKLWPNRTVPVMKSRLFNHSIQTNLSFYYTYIKYAISPLYEPEDMITIMTAIRTISTMTCVKFVRWNGKQDDFLLIWPIKFPK